MGSKQSLIVDVVKGESLIKINPNLQHVSSVKASWDGIQVGHYRQIATFDTPEHCFEQHMISIHLGASIVKEQRFDGRTDSAS